MKPLSFEEWLKTVDYKREMVEQRIGSNDNFCSDIQLIELLRDLKQTFIPDVFDLVFRDHTQFKTFFEKKAQSSSEVSSKIFEYLDGKGSTDVRIEVDNDFDDNITVYVVFEREETDGEFEWRLEDGPYKKYVETFTNKSNQILNLTREKERLETLLNSQSDLQKSIADLKAKIKEIEDGL